MALDVFAPAGKCQFCGCTEQKPCRLETGDPCWWVFRQRNVCSKPECMRRYHDEVRKQAQERRKRRLTSADVHALIRRHKKPVKRPLKPAKGRKV
jgi:hypothetical protein